jgi:hypothetical protein
MHVSENNIAKIFMGPPVLRNDFHYEKVSKGYAVSQLSAHGFSCIKVEF